MTGYIAWMPAVVLGLGFGFGVYGQTASTQPTGERQYIFMGDDYYPPFQYLENGEPAGFDVDVLRAVAQVMDLDIRIEMGRWGQVREEVEAGRIDGLVGMCNTPERAVLVDFATTHVVLTHSIFVRRDSSIKTLDDIRAKQIIVQDGGVMDDYVTGQAITDDVIRVRDYVDALHLLNSGRYDCAVLSQLPGLYWVKKLRLNDIVAVGPPIEPCDFCFAVAKGRGELRDVLSKGLANIRASGQFQEIYARWFGGTTDTNGWRRLIRVFWWIVGGLLLVLLLLAVWSWMLRKRVAIKTQQLRQELASRERLTQVLVNKNEELESIIYATSHDLRSPLINIQGFSRELRGLLGEIKEVSHHSTTDGQAEAIIALDQNMAECCDYIESGVSKMDSLLRGVLQVSRLGQSKLYLHELDMSELVKGVIDAMRYQIEAVEGSVTVKTLPPCRADESQMVHVFDNLIGNAIKYRSPDRACEIEITGRRENSNCLYCVSDNGAGIDARYLDKIFLLFHRGDVDADVPGEGVGLTIVKRIVARHNGRLWVESVPGQGSQFTISIPATQTLKDLGPDKTLTD